MAGLDFAAFAAERLQRDSVELTRAWLERIESELHVRPRRALPADSLLATIPAVLRRVATCLEAEPPGGLAADPEVSEPLRALAQLRQALGSAPEELLHEFYLLAGVLDAGCLQWLRAFMDTPTPDTVVRVTGRLNRAPIQMGEIVVGAFREAEQSGGDDGAARLEMLADALGHELNTPLGAAEAAALLLGDDELMGDGPERHRLGELVRRNVRRARSVIRDVRALALGRTTGAPADRPVALADILADVQAEVADRLLAAAVRLEVSEPVPVLYVDAAHVELILLNLIDNAAKYADGGRDDRWVVVRFGRETEDPAGWWLEVSDNGIGIPPEQQAHVYERFFRAHPGRADGTGLGLAIVQEAVTQLGGRIELESEPGIGTIFRVHLPACASGSEGFGGGSAAAPPSASPPRRPGASSAAG